MVSVSASVNLSLHDKVQKFSSGTDSPRGSRKRAVKWLWCGGDGGQWVGVNGPPCGVQIDVLALLAWYFSTLDALPSA